MKDWLISCGLRTHKKANDYSTKCVHVVALCAPSVTAPPKKSLLMVCCDSAAMQFNAIRSETTLDILNAVGSNERSIKQRFAVTQYMVK